MKISIFLVLVACFSHSLAMADFFDTANRIPHIIILDHGLDEQELDACVESICKLSGSDEAADCKIVSNRARIVVASLSESAVQEVQTLSCVKSLRPELRFTPRPRSGRSN